MPYVNPAWIGALAHMLGAPFEEVQGYSNQHKGQAPPDLNALNQWASSPDWAYGITRRGSDGSYHAIGNGSANPLRSPQDNAGHPEFANVNNLEDYQNQYGKDMPFYGDGSVDPRWNQIFGEYQSRGGDDAFFGSGLKPGATSAAPQQTQQASTAQQPASAGAASMPNNNYSGIPSPTGGAAAGWQPNIPAAFNWGDNTGQWGNPTATFGTQQPSYAGLAPPSFSGAYSPPQPTQTGGGVQPTNKKGAKTSQKPDAGKKAVKDVTAPLPTEAPTAGGDPSNSYASGASQAPAGADAANLYNNALQNAMGSGGGMNNLSGSPATGPKDPSAAPQDAPVDAPGGFGNTGPTGDFMHQLYKLLHSVYGGQANGLAGMQPQ